MCQLAFYFSAGLEYPKRVYKVGRKLQRDAHLLPAKVLSNKEEFYPQGQLAPQKLGCSDHGPLSTSVALPSLPCKLQSAAITKLVHETPCFAIHREGFHDERVVLQL
jgi:hypothetical protein